MNNTINKSYKNETKIVELESIRGLAALLIVFCHIPHWNSNFDFEIVKNGYLMVELFFVLSGFVIYTAYSKKMTNFNDLIKFQFLRFGRLYPVHLLCLSAFVFIELARYIAETKFNIISPNTRAFRENNLVALFQQFFLTQAIGPTGHALTYNVPSWSISVEFYTYLLFGLVSLYLIKIRTYVFFILFAIALGLMLNDTMFGLDHLLRCHAGFFLGCLVARLNEKISITLPSWLSFLTFIALLIFLVCKSQPQYDAIIYFLTAILIFTLVSSRNGILKLVLNCKPLIWLGKISYSLYMCHYMIVWSANQFVRVILKKPEVMIHGYSTPVLSFAETLLAYLLIFPIVLTVSSIVYHVVEKPFRDRSRRYVFRVSSDAEPLTVTQVS